MTRSRAVVINGKPVYRDYPWMKTRRDRGLSVAEIADEAGCSYHTVRAWLRRHELQFRFDERNFAPGHVPWNKGKRGYTLERDWTDAQKDAIRAARSGPKTLPQRKGCKLTGHAVQIVAVDYVGLRQTYDLAIEGPWHNFVANGIVVHNSFNEESARYHKLADDFYVPTPGAVRSQVGRPGAYSFEPVDEAIAAETIDTFRRVYKEFYAEYLALIDRGVAKELARALLPFGIFTQFYWTLNARALMNFLSLRNSEFAQYEIRVYAEAVERLFRERMPLTHECFVDFGRRAP